MSRRVVLGVMLTLLLVNLFSLALNIQPVEATEPTIYIGADGSVDPPTAPIRRDGDLYILTGNISYDIVQARDYYILVARDNIVIEGAGFTLQGPFSGCGIGIYLQYRSNVTIKNMEIKRFSDGIHLSYSSNSTISENKITYSNMGIRLGYSSSNGIFGNKIEAISGDGVGLYESSNNRIEKNSITGSWSGVGLTSSSNNSFAENNITASYFDGIVLVDSSNNNSVYGNEITNNAEDGIHLRYSSDNTVSGNKLAANNGKGIYLESSSNNRIFHNNFIDNAQQVYSDESVNVWDDGYPSGGNYWSDYNGVDANHDGIGDTPYVIDANNTDHYPLMTQYIIPEFPVFFILPLFMMVTLLAVIAYTRKNKLRDVMQDE